MMQTLKILQVCVFRVLAGSMYQLMDYHLDQPKFFNVVAINWTALCKIRFSYCFLDYRPLQCLRHSRTKYISVCIR